MHIRERIALLQEAAQSVPLPEGWQEKHQLEADIADLEFELGEYQRIVGEVLSIAQQHQRELEDERRDLRRKRDGDTPLTFRDFRLLERRDLDRTVEDPARLLEVSRIGDGNLQGRIDDWIRRLQAEELITPAEVRSIKTAIGISPARLAQLKQEADEHQKLIDARDHILKTIQNPADRHDALTQYNLLDQPLSESKLDSWVQRCVSARLLPMEWLAGRRLGAKLNEFIRGKV